MDGLLNTQIFIYGHEMVFISLNFVYDGISAPFDTCLFQMVQNVKR